MSGKSLEVKLPQDLIDIIPQERITGDILRGHGPRRGNLEALLKYWRPIMRKPGGFRRCIVILANHPELYPLQRICAWLHHETTGKWPNEGNHHGGGGAARAAGRVARRAIPGKRRRRRGKSDDGVEIASWRVYRRLARMDGGITVRPIDGDQNAVAYKAARFVQGMRSVPMPGSFDWDKRPIEVKRSSGHGRIGRTLSSIASYFTPGDMSKYRSPIRSALWGALFPGGGGAGGRGGAGRPSIGGGALRCPTGYINGGRFTDPKLSNCGGLVFDVPAKGPGAVTAGDVSKMTRRFESMKPQDVPDVVRDVVVKKPKGDPFAVVREAAIRPNRAGSPARRDSVVNDVVEYASTNIGTTRLVRRDGVVYEPMLTSEELVRMKDHDAIKGAVYVTSKIGKGAIAGDEIRLLSKGAHAVEYVYGEGSVRLERKGEIPAGVAAKMRTRWASISRDPDIIINPFTPVEKFVKEFSEFIEIKPTFKGVKKPNERVVVMSSDGVKRVVPRWVHNMYLSPRAPRRLAGIKPYNIMKESGKKSLDGARFDRRQYAALAVHKKNLAMRPDLSDQFGKPSLADLRLSDTGGMSRDALIELKAARFVLAKLDEDMAVKVFGRRRMRGVRLSRFARRIPKVVPYNPRARDADGDGLVQEGTIWERPSGTIFRGLRAGARKLAGTVELVDGSGKRVDYKPGENQRSPLRTSRFDPMKRRLAGVSERFGGRREQGIRRRDREEGAIADFTEVELRRRARKARRQRAIAKIRERGAGVRERRTQRMERGAERDEAAAGRHVARAAELTGQRRDRDEFDRSRRGLRERQRGEREELDEQNPRRQRRTQRREERRRRMQERLTEFGERREEGIRREDERRGARADFGVIGRERAERRRGRRSVAERAAAASEGLARRREEAIRREDERRGARADFGKLDREREARRRDRRGPTRRSERAEQQRGRAVDAADRVRDRNEEAIRRRDRREGAQADFGKLDRERAERRRRRREGPGRTLAEATERFRGRREESIRRRDSEEGAVADFRILEREREERQAARVLRAKNRRAVRHQRRERVRRRLEKFGERQEAAIRLRDREERAIADFSDVELRREMRNQRVRDFMRRVREINADRDADSREAGRKAAKARVDSTEAVSRRFNEILARRRPDDYFGEEGPDVRRARADRADAGYRRDMGMDADPVQGMPPEQLFIFERELEEFQEEIKDWRLREVHDFLPERAKEILNEALPRSDADLLPNERSLVDQPIRDLPEKWQNIIAEIVDQAFSDDPDALRSGQRPERVITPTSESDERQADYFDWMRVSSERRAARRRERFGEPQKVQGMPRVELTEVDDLRLELNDGFFDRYWDLDENGYNIESGIYMHSRFGDSISEGGGNEIGRRYDELMAERREILRDHAESHLMGVDPDDERRVEDALHSWSSLFEDKIKRLQEISDEIEQLYEGQTTPWMGVSDEDRERFEAIQERLTELGASERFTKHGTSLIDNEPLRGMPTFVEMGRADTAFERGMARRKRLREIRERRLAGEDVKPEELFTDDGPLQSGMVSPTRFGLDGPDVAAGTPRQTERERRLQAARKARRQASDRRRAAARRARLTKEIERRKREREGMSPEARRDADERGDPYRSIEGQIYDLEQGIQGMPTLEEMVQADTAFERGMARRTRLKEMRNRREAAAREKRAVVVSDDLERKRRRQEQEDNPVRPMTDEDLGEMASIFGEDGDALRNFVPKPEDEDRPEFGTPPAGEIFRNLVPTPNDTDLPSADELIRYQRGDEVKVGSRTGTVLRVETNLSGGGQRYIIDFEGGENSESIPAYQVTAVDPELKRKRYGDGLERHYYPDGVVPVEDLTGAGLRQEMQKLYDRWSGVDVIPAEDIIRYQNLLARWVEVNPGIPRPVPEILHGDGSEAGSRGRGLGRDRGVIRGMPSVERLLASPPDRDDPDVDDEDFETGDAAFNPMSGVWREMMRNRPELAGGGSVQGMPRQLSPDDRIWEGRAERRLIANLFAEVEHYLGEGYFDAFRVDELDKAVRDALLLIRATRNGEDLRFADILEPSRFWPKGLVHSELGLTELFSKEGMHKSLLGGVFDGQWEDLPELVRIELDDPEGWANDPIGKVQAVLQAVIDAGEGTADAYKEFEYRPEVLRENITQILQKIDDYNEKLESLLDKKSPLIEGFEGGMRDMDEGGHYGTGGALARQKLAALFVEKQIETNERRRAAIMEVLEAAKERKQFTPEESDAPDPVLPKSVREYLTEFVQRSFGKRIWSVRKEYERRGKGPDMMVENFEDIGIDVAAIKARGSITHEEKTAIKRWVVSTLSIGDDNAWLGKKGVMWRVGRGGDLDDAMDTISVDFSSSEGIEIHYNTHLYFKPPEDYHGEFGGVAVMAPADEWTRTGSTQRVIRIKPSTDPGLKPTVSIYNAALYANERGFGTTGLGMANFYNHNAWLHVARIGGSESKITVTPATDGKVIWGMMGFDSPTTVTNAIHQLKKELKIYRERGKPGMVRDEQMAEELQVIFDIHDNAIINGDESPISTFMIHAVLKRGRDPHPWENVKLEKIHTGGGPTGLIDADAMKDAEEDPSNKVGTGLGISANAYGHWWQRHAPTGGSGAHIGRGEVNALLQKVAAEIASMGREDVDTPDSPRSKQERSVSIPLHTGRRNPPSQLSLGEADELGRLQLVSKSTGDSSIRTAPHAAEHIRSGGSLSNIPRELFLEAVLANSSDLEIDDSTLFRLITVDDDHAAGPAVNRGTLGTSYVFLKRGTDGSAGSEAGLDQGFIIKSPDYYFDTDAAGQLWNQRAIAGASQYNEVIGRQMSQLLGDPTGGVMVDGMDERGNPYLVMEFSNVTANIGREIPLAEMGPDERRQPEVLKSRLRATLIGYAMGLGDRHGGNLLVGQTFEGGGMLRHTGVVNIDFQRAFRANPDFRTYLDGHVAEGGGVGLDLAGDLRRAVSNGELSREDLVTIMEEVGDKIREIKEVHLSNIIGDLAVLSRLGGKDTTTAGMPLSRGIEDAGDYGEIVREHLELVVMAFEDVNTMLENLFDDEAEELFVSLPERVFG
jgi:hypothetical protein